MRAAWAIRVQRVGQAVHIVYPTDENGRKVAEPVIISIDLADITLS